MGRAKTAVVLAGGEAADLARVPVPPPDLVVAADSGVHLAARLGFHVDIVVGDLDSATPEAVDAAVRAGATIERYPQAKDATDLELALDAAVREGAECIVVLGGAGGRLDHLLGNLLLLAAPAYAATEMRAVIGRAAVAVAVGGRPPVRIAGVPGSLVTLLPMGGAARGIVTSGLEYPLRDEDLLPATTRGVSNVMTDPDASIALREGALLVVQPDAGQGVLE